MYGKEGINALYFKKKKITANTQVTIDEFIQTLIIDLNLAILPGLPDTTLTYYEEKQINQIMKYKIQDLWKRFKNDDPTLSDA